MGLKKKFGDLDDKTVGKSRIFLHFSGQKMQVFTLRRNQGIKLMVKVSSLETAPELAVQVKTKQSVSESK